MKIGCSELLTWQVNVSKLVDSGKWLFGGFRQRQWGMNNGKVLTWKVSISYHYPHEIVWR